MAKATAVHIAEPKAMVDCAEVKLWVTVTVIIPAPVVDEPMTVEEAAERDILNEAANAASPYLPQSVREYRGKILGKVSPWGDGYTATVQVSADFRK